MNNAEQKIKKALDKSAELHRTGLDPNEAIIKAASEGELNPEMTRRVVEQFNISKTNNTLKVAEDKTASFPLAQIDPILKGVFVDAPLSPKKAEEKSPVLADDKLRIIKVVPQSKTAASTLPEVSPYTVSDWVRQTSGLVHESNCKLADLRAELLGAEQKAHAQMSEVVDFFSTSNNIGKWAQFEGEILSEYGDQAKPTLDIIHGLIGIKEPRFTGRISKLGNYSIDRTPAHIAFDKLIEHSNEYIDIHNKRAELALELQTNVDQVSKSLLSVQGASPEPYVKRAADLFDFGGASLKKAVLGLEAISGAATKLQDGIHSGATSSLTNQFTKAHDQALKTEVSIPKDEVDAEDQNIRRTTILRDLIANDDSLSSADPKSIQSAYNVLLQLAPDVTLNQGVTQAFLRSSLAQQAVDPFSATQIAQLQQQILKNKQLQSGKAPVPGT